MRRSVVGIVVTAILAGGLAGHGSALAQNAPLKGDLNSANGGNLAEAFSSALENLRRQYEAQQAAAIQQAVKSQIASQSGGGQQGTSPPNPNETVNTSQSDACVNACIQSMYSCQAAALMAGIADITAEIKAWENVNADFQTCSDILRDQNPGGALPSTDALGHFVPAYPAGDYAVCGSSTDYGPPPYTTCTTPTNCVTKTYTGNSGTSTNILIANCPAPHPFSEIQSQLYQLLTNPQTKCVMQVTACYAGCGIIVNTQSGYGPPTGPCPGCTH